MDISETVVSPQTQRLIDMIALCKQFEHDLPLINSVDELEKRRVELLPIITWEPGSEESTQFIVELRNWVRRVGLMCQRRRGQLIHEFRVNGEKKIFHGHPGDPKDSLPLPPMGQHYHKDAGFLAKQPEETVQKAIDADIQKHGEFNKKRVIKQLRMDAKAKGNPIDEKTA